MRLVTYAKNGRVAVGVKLDEGIAPCREPNMISLIAGGERAINSVREQVERAMARGELVKPDRILAPIPRPGKILCAEDNYRSVLAYEVGRDFPQHPHFFSKLPSAVIGPGDQIVIRSPELEVDYEVELAVVIGKTAWKVPSALALNYVFGYTVINDVSARDIQLGRKDMVLGKGMDTFCPMGPEIVLVDEIPDPGALRLDAYVNGEQRQSEATRSMHFGVAQLIEALTEVITLEPGDLISTGTPGGVGLLQTPPRYLKPGDEVVVEVDRIGRLTNSVSAGWV